MYKVYKNVINSAVAVFLLFIHLSANASLQRANNLFDNKKYDAAFVEFEKYAHIGSEPAQLKLAVMYMEGIGTQKDIVKSYLYLSLSADNGNPQAKEYSAQIYNGLDEINKNKADKLWQEMSTKYTTEGLTNAALPQLKKRIIRERRAKKIRQKIYKGSSNLINTSTLSNVPRTSVRSLSVTFDVRKDGKARDIEIDRNFFMPTTGIDAFFTEINNSVYHSANLRGNKAQSVDSYDYNGRLSTSVNTDYVKKHSPRFYKKLKKWERDAKKDDLESQFNYAMVAIYFPFLKLDPTKNIVRSYMKNAAESGMADAQLEYSKMLLRGDRYFKKNLKEASKYLVASAKAGHARAQYKLGRQLLNSNVIITDETKAIFWLTKAANQQDNYAKYWLARVLLTSEDNTLRNPEKAQILLTETKKIQEKNPNWYYYSALAEYQLGNNTQSKAFITTAITKAEVLEWEVPEFKVLASKFI